MDDTINATFASGNDTVIAALHYVTPNLLQTSEWLEHRVALGLIVFVLPAIIVFGTVGNILSFAVLTHARMCHTSMYFYLCALACADTSVLYLSSFKTWIRAVSGFELLHTSNFGCKTVMFLFLVGLHMSAWMIVLLTADRFIAVWFPFKMAALCTLRRARITTATALAVALFYNAHVFWTIRLQEYTSGERRVYQCSARPWDYFMHRVFPYLKLVTYAILPFTLVLVFNLAIIFRVTRNSSLRSDGGVQGTETSMDRHRQGRITYMLLTVSFMWLALSAPFTFWYFFDFRTEDSHSRARFFLGKTICFLLMYTNHGINFYLYCITGRKFRRELHELCCSRRKKNRRTTSNRLSSVKSSRLTKSLQVQLEKPNNVNTVAVPVDIIPLNAML